MCVWCVFVCVYARVFVCESVSRRAKRRQMVDKDFVCNSSSPGLFFFVLLGLINT